MIDKQIVAIRKFTFGMLGGGISQIKLSDGSIMDINQAVYNIEYSQHQYFTMDAFGRRTSVRVQRGWCTGPYLIAESDNSTSNNLLSLPKF